MTMAPKGVAEADKSLNCLDIAGTMVATGGNEGKLSVFDEATGSLTMVVKSGGTGAPGHKQRIFSCRFDKENSQVMYSGGWDDAVFVTDLREGTYVSMIPGPHICGDTALDVQGHLLVAASYRNQNNLATYDLRHSLKALQYLDMDTSSGPIPHYSECLLYTA